MSYRACSGILELCTDARMPPALPRGLAHDSRDAVNTDPFCPHITDSRCPPDLAGASLCCVQTQGGHHAQPRGLAHDTRDARKRLLSARYCRARRLFGADGAAGAKRGGTLVGGQYRLQLHHVFESSPHEFLSTPLFFEKTFNKYGSLLRSSLGFETSKYLM